MGDYRGFVEDFLHKTYTIGGEIIFPKHRGSINQARGVSPQICDRFDLTLECIRRYYAGVSSPLYGVLCGDGRYFDLFGDYRGYVDFFLLQDLVSEDYFAVIFDLAERLAEREEYYIRMAIAWLVAECSYRVDKEMKEIVR